jgi:hypothetical protein
MYRKNISGQFLYFGLVSASNGSPLTGATVTALRAIDGGAQTAVTGTIAEDGSGQYHLSMSQADTNGNNIGFMFNATNAIPVSISMITTNANPYDAVHYGLSSLPNAAASASGGLPTIGTGSGQITLSSGDVTVGSNLDKTGYSITQAFPTNFSTLLINGSGQVTLANGQIYIKKDQALNNFEFLMTNSTTHIPQTGLTVAAKVSIDGAAFVNTVNSPSEVGSGIYKLNLAAADVNGTVIMLLFTATGADNRYVSIITQP